MSVCVVEIEHKRFESFCITKFDLTNKKVKDIISNGLDIQGHPTVLARLEDSYTLAICAYGLALGNKNTNLAAFKQKLMSKATQEGNTSSIVT